MGFDFVNDRRLIQEAEYLDQLISNDILRPLSPELFPAERGTLTIACADGDQHHDLESRHRSVCKGRDCHHAFAINGLSLRLAPGSPVARPFESEYWLSEALVGYRLKQLGAITIYGHWPCGIAYNNHLSIERQLELYIRGKDAIRDYFREHDEDPKLVLCLHVHDGRNSSRSRNLYYFDRHKWTNFVMRQQASARHSELIG